jgi:cytochrome P450
MFRKAVKPFTFSDGTTIPVGTTVAVPLRSLHHDADLYSDPEVFDAFRFFNGEDQVGEGTRKGQFVTTSASYVPFGHGKHGWYVIPCYLKLDRF